MGSDHWCFPHLQSTVLHLQKGRSRNTHLKKRIGFYHMYSPFGEWVFSTRWERERHSVLQKPFFLSWTPRQSQSRLGCVQWFSRLSVPSWRRYCARCRDAINSTVALDATHVMRSWKSLANLKGSLNRRQGRMPRSSLERGCVRFMQIGRTMARLLRQAAM